MDRPPSRAVISSRSLIISNRTAQVRGIGAGALFQGAQRGTRDRRNGAVHDLDNFANIDLRGSDAQRIATAHAAFAGEKSGMPERQQICSRYLIGMFSFFDNSWI